MTATTGTLNLPGSYGAASISLPNHGDWAIFICDGTNHDLISGSPAIMAAEIASIASGGALASGKMVAIATSATTVATITPSAAGNFLISGYFTIITAPTVITVTVTYTDAIGSQTETLINAVSYAIGSYPWTAFMINSAAGDAITVSMTAGTASQVVGDASIWQG